MSAERLLDRLEGVKPNGPGRWMAKCPAHQDHSPSLSIRDADDRLLVHCFAGCSAHDIVAAVGLTLADLFEKPLDHHKGALRDRRHQHAACAALKVLSHESLVALIAAENIARGRQLSDEDRDRLTLAAVRIRNAREAAA